MDIPYLKARCYDVYGVSAALISGCVLLPCFALGTPIFALPVLIQTAVKVAYHSSRFFLAIRNSSIKNTEALLKRACTSQDLPLLKQEEIKLYHKGRMNACIAKIRIWLWGLIPGYGAWQIALKLNGPTNLNKDALESDLASVKRIIRQLTL